MLTEQQMLNRIASYDYGVYSANGKIIIADPIGGDDGWYVQCDSIAEAYNEWETSGILDGDVPDTDISWRTE